MNELPPRARDLLRLARDQHVCRDPEARRRVREGVARAIGVGAGTPLLRPAAPAHASASSAAPLSGVGAKAVLSGLVVAVVGVGLALRPWHESRETVSRAVVSRVSTVALHASALEGQGGEPRPAAVHVPAQPGPAPAQPARDPLRAVEEERVPARAPAQASVLAARGAHAESDTLFAEVELLRRVGEAVARRDAHEASGLLAQHRARFSRPVLRQEREGFSLLVRCMERRSGSATAARGFIERYPHSVLSDRVARACAASGDEP